MMNASLSRWLDAVLSRSDAGRHILEADYDISAKGEAVPGCLNATVALHSGHCDRTRLRSSSSGRRASGMTPWAPPLGT